MSNILGPKQGYVEILAHYTQELLNEKSLESRTSNPLRPSSAGKDARELAYEFMEYRGYAKYESEAMNPESHRLLNLGNPIEKHLIWEFREAFKRAGKDIDVKYQQQVLSFFKLNDGTQIEGQIDLALIPKSKKFGGCVADVKSKKDKFSAFYKTGWDELSAKLTAMKTVDAFGEECFWVEDLDAFLLELDDYFFAQNFYQLNMYFFDEHSFLRSRGVDHAAIFQYCKNDSRVREIRFKPSQALFDKVKAKFLLIQTQVDLTKDPTSVPRENVLGSIACAFSKYRKIDWPEDDALKAFFNELPSKQWPKDLDRLGAEGQELADLFDKYLELSEVPDVLEKVEQKIVSTLDKIKVFKVRLSNGFIYQMKRLKSGGPGSGERLVLRRSKL